VSRHDSPRIKILLVDDHPIVRKGLSQLITDERDMIICGETETPARALHLVAAERPTVAIVDLALGAASGLELVKTLTASHPEVRVLVLSMHDEKVYAERALRAGASGYIMKHEASQKLLTAIRQVASGKIYVSELMSARILSGVGGRRVPGANVSPLSSLTPKEWEIFELTGKGLGTRDIAKQMDVSPKTVETHYANIKEKLGLGSMRDLIRFAAQWTSSL
jgi:DNA-binding NarL/FixJ family response regulator